MREGQSCDKSSDTAPSSDRVNVESSFNHDSVAFLSGSHRLASCERVVSQSSEPGGSSQVDLPPAVLKPASFGQLKSEFLVDLASTCVLAGLARSEASCPAAGDSLGPRHSRLSPVVVHEEWQPCH